MLKYWICFFSLALTACGSLPATRQEFREYSKQHGGVHDFIVDETFAIVLARLKDHVAKCNDLKIKTRQGPSRMVDYIIPKWEHVTANTATLLIVQDSPQILNQPKGGQILTIVDLFRQSSKTNASVQDLHLPSWAVYDYTTELTNVINGRPATCQLEEYE